MITSQYQHLEAELGSVIGRFQLSSTIGLRLERIEQLLAHLGNPHQRFRSIHVGGTSGKGSTARMIAGVLDAAGVRVGLHTSPHLQVVNERHQINGRSASTTRLLELWEQVGPAVERVGRESPFGPPSYFETHVALSCLLFAEEAVDVAVVEVGLGGTLDATNILPSEIAIVTNVGLDHTEILGETVEKIATDKAGIIKNPDQIGISGSLIPSVRKIIQNRADSVGAVCKLLGRDFEIRSADVNSCSLAFPGHGIEIENLKLGMPGTFQAYNAAVAIEAVLNLKEVPVSEAAIRKGIGEATLPGRVEIMQQEPLVMLDGAHNPDKIKASASVVAGLPTGRVITILGMKSGKDVLESIPPVIEMSDEIIITGFLPKGMWTCVPPAELAEAVRQLNSTIPLTIVEDNQAAVEQALNKATPNDMVLGIGSLYLVGDLRLYWEPLETVLDRIETEWHAH